MKHLNMKHISKSIWLKKEDRKIFFFFLFLFISSSAFSQSIQWTSSIINYSSQAEFKEYAAEQIIGPPSDLNSIESPVTAWKPKDDSRKEFLHVAFAKPMRIKQVIVIENSNPGGVCRVVLYDKNNMEYEVYKAKADTLDVPYRVFSVKFDLTPYEVVSVKVIIDCRVTPGENQIDAIGISNTHDEFKFKGVQMANVKFFSEAEKLDANINSEYSEVAPQISPDGKTLYYCRKNYPPHVDDDEIWYSTLADKKWIKSLQMGEPLNNKNGNAVEASTPDGNTLVLIQQYNKDGSSGSGFSFTHRINNGWSFPENAVIKNFINNDRYAGFYLANSGKVIVTQLRREDTKGNSDLYAMFRQNDGSWTEPLRMGDSINTIGAECTPFLAADEATIYFSTDGLPGFGSNDIYMSRRKDDTWKNWTAPLNMGNVLNSKDWDAYYSIPASGEFAYFVRSGDIYRIRLSEEFKPKPVVLISGTVYNQKTNQPVSEASIRYEFLNNGTEAGIARTNPANGQYKIVLPFGRNYGFMANANGFLTVSDNMDLTDLKEYKEIKKDLYLVPIEIGEIVRMNNIFFDFGKATLKPESFPELDRVVDFLKKNPSIEIELGGHTDNVGGDAANLQLSQDRTNSVMAYLESKGIAKGRVAAKGYGETKPISDNDTEEGRALNRRVEFTITKK